MKKELIVVIAFIASMSIVSAQFFGYNITFSDIARNEMVNAALLFLLIFSLSLFVLKDVFQRSYGAAIIIALVVGAIGALATISFYGPIIPLLAPWMIVIALAVIALILWRFLSGFAGIIWILAAIALLWLFVTRRKVCGVGALLPYEACVIIDFIAIAVLIIAAFNLFYKMFAGWRALPPSTPGIPGAGLFMLEIRPEGNGTTRPAPGYHRYKQNSRVRVVARPAPGAAFDHWELDGTNMGRNTTIVVLMNIDHTLVAYFTEAAPKVAPPLRETVALKMSVQGKGNTIPRPGTYTTYRKGVRATIRATPAAGFRFSHWVINGVIEKRNPCTLVMDRDKNIVAIFTVAKKPTPPKQAKGMWVKIRLDRKSVAAPGEIVRAIATWGGSVPPYTVLFYVRGNPVSKIRQPRGTRAQAAFPVRGNAGEKVIVGVLVEGADKQLKEANAELRIV